MVLTTKDTTDLIRLAIEYWPALSERLAETWMLSLENYSPETVRAAMAEHVRYQEANTVPTLRALLDRIRSIRIYSGQAEAAAPAPAGSRVTNLDELVSCVRGVANRDAVAWLRELRERREEKANQP